ncbi:MAG: hypothetical protein WCR29_00845 [Bacteroidales bacterium]|nr:hypothetical protein [Bacteroidales bacterium]
MKQKVNKLRVIISFNKLTKSQLLMFSQAYSEGYSSYIQKINKPSGEVIYVVPFETEDTIYMVKVDVKVDAKLTEEEFDKEILRDSKNHDFSAEQEKEEEEEEKPSKDTFVLVHGDYAAEKIDDDDDDDDDDDEGEDEK